MSSGNEFTSSFLPAFTAGRFYMKIFPVAQEAIFVMRYRLYRKEGLLTILLMRRQYHSSFGSAPRDI
jgi:hypothetical protein